MAALISDDFATDWMDAMGGGAGHLVSAPSCPPPPLSQQDLREPAGAALPIHLQAAALRRNNLHSAFAPCAGSSTASVSGGSCLSLQLGATLSRSSSGASNGSASGAASALPLQAAALPQGSLAAPAPHRAAVANGAKQLLCSYSAFDGLHPPPLSGGAAAGAAPRAAAGTGPAPEALLAALCASLAQQQQERQAAAAAAAAARPAFACAVCSSAFADAEAYHSHCASLEHTLAVLSGGMALSVPSAAARVSGGCCRRPPGMHGAAASPACLHTPTRRQLRSQPLMCDSPTQAWPEPTAPPCLQPAPPLPCPPSPHGPRRARWQPRLPACCVSTLRQWQRLRRATPLCLLRAPLGQAAFPASCPTALPPPAPPSPHASIR
jgi:hypothetical protein